MFLGRETDTESRHQVVEIKVARKQAKEIKATEGKPLQIQFNMPVDMPSVYATNILLQRMEHEVLISFYEVQPPILLNADDREGAAEALEKSGIRADCIAKVIIANERFAGFADVMKQLANQLKAAQKESRNV